MRTYGRYNLSVGIRWRWVVSFTPRPLYPRGKRPRYRFNWRHCGSLQLVWMLWRRENFLSSTGNWGARGSIVGWGTMLTSRNVVGSSPDEMDFFNWPNRSSRTMALGSTQPLTEMSTRNLTSGRRVRLTISEPSVSRLSRENVGASTSHSPMGLHGLLQG
jgi:hypothetical protein